MSIFSVKDCSNEWLRQSPDATVATGIFIVILNPEYSGLLSNAEIQKERSNNLTVILNGRPSFPLRQDFSPLSCCVRTSVLDAYE